MNLADLLLANRSYCRPATADSADSAESQQWQGLRSPQVVAESCGMGAGAGGVGYKLEVIRNNPQLVAEAASRSTKAFPHNPHNPQGRRAEVEKPLPLAREWFAAQGVELLREDVEFLFRRLPKGTVARNAAIRQYIAQWMQAMDAEPLAQKKINRGRFAANSWLREFVL